jgi:hypothetical protein
MPLVLPIYLGVVLPKWVSNEHPSMVGLCIARVGEIAKVQAFEAFTGSFEVQY